MIERETTQGVANPGAVKPAGPFIRSVAEPNWLAIVGSATVELTVDQWRLICGSAIRGSLHPDDRGWPGPALADALDALHDALGDSVFYGEPER